MLDFDITSSRHARGTIRRSVRLHRAVLAAVALLLPVITVTSASGSTAVGQPVGPVAIPDTAYDAPADAVFVAPDGNDASPGSQAAPVGTVKRAAALAKAGGTVVLRGGTYRQALGVVRKRITLQPYPHEQAWLSGSQVVTGWTAEGSVWIHSGWITRFCQNCYVKAAIDSRFPLAGKPDMAFLDGTPLRQVGSAAAVVPGTFAVDRVGHRLVIGSDPAGATVEASTRVRFALFSPGSRGSMIRGLGFTHYSPNWASNNNPAMVVANTDDMTLENNAFTQSASRALVVFGQRTIVRGNLVVNNGFTGVGGAGAHYLLFERNVVSGNNAEHFFAGGSPVADVAGTKIAHSYHMVVRDNVFTGNVGNGFWADLSCYDLTLVRNTAARNNNSGLYVELTTKGLVASNLAYRNGFTGLKLSGTTNIRVYNNTLANNKTYQTYVIDDGRNNTNASQLALGITWSTANNTYLNNIFSVGTTSTGPVLKTRDNNRPKSNPAANMITGMDSNAYFRASTASPGSLAWWTQVGAPPTSYPDLLSFQVATGYEAAGVEMGDISPSPFFVDEAADDYRLQSASPASGTGAPLPDDVAAAIGAPAGVPVDRGALTWPGSG